MKLIDSKRLTMSQAARRLGVHVSTVWRWRLRGVRGQRLKTVVIGGTRYVLETDLHKFLSDLNGGDAVRDEDLDSRAGVAAAQLDAMGVKDGRHG